MTFFVWLWWTSKKICSLCVGSQKKFSMGCLTNWDLWFFFNKKRCLCWIMNFQSLLMGCVIFQLRLYFFSNNPSCSNPINLFTTPNLACLNRFWHQCIGHIHQKNMILMSKHEIVANLPNIEPWGWIYKACILGKQTRERAPHQSFHHYSKTPWKIIHNDVCGPLSQPSFIGAW